jgi:hypothetical protein
MTGSAAFAYGLSSGIAGIVTKPIDGAKKSGALGFLKGVGQGVMGAAVSPIVGVTDGLAAVAHGLNTQVVASVQLTQIRPPRLLRRMVLGSEESAGYRLEPLDARLVEADSAIRRHASELSITDTVLELVELGPKENVVVSTLAISLQEAVTGHSKLSLEFKNISHVRRWNDATVIEIVSFAAEGSHELYSTSAFKCHTIDRATALYTVLTKEADRMRNPSAISDLTFQAG